jgi:hypothetical protein
MHGVGDNYFAALDGDAIALFVPGRVVDIRGTFTQTPLLI